MYEPVKEETQEQYLKIWAHYSIGYTSRKELSETFNCSQDTVENAIKWVASNRPRFSSLIMAEVAKEALEGKLRELQDDLAKLKDETPKNWFAIIGINKLVKSNQESLWRLQAIIDEKSNITINNTQVNTSNVVSVARDMVEQLPEIKVKAISAMLATAHCGGEINKLERVGNVVTIEAVVPEWWDTLPKIEYKREEIL